MLHVHHLKQFYFRYAYRFASTSTHALGKDYYSILGVSRTADVKQIKSAFYELSNKYHPDRNPNDKENASEKFQAILNAYEVLSNPTKRKEYDLGFFMNDDLDPTSVRARHNQNNWRFMDMSSDSKDIRVARSRDFYRANALSNRLSRWNVTARDSAKESFFKDPEVRSNLKAVKEVAYYMGLLILGFGVLRALYIETNF
ncbi:Molecular chaperone DnaJ [Aphelenchoides bicaudatus]|nr:Molecular chaperone DnaJ [Aphelenchoides bicaudatus]